jgi:hypothetical protein
MPDGPWTKYAPAPAAPDAAAVPAPAGPWTKYSAGTQGLGTNPEPPGKDFSEYDKPYPTPPGLPLEKEPGTTYGKVLPLAQDAQGHMSLAVPDIIRAPLRGMIAGGQEARGLRPVDQPEERSDITAAASVLGGTRNIAEGAKNMETGARPAALEARKAGYVLPPASINDKPGFLSSIMAGWSGKIKTQQAASAKNQEVTNGLAAKALGLPPGTPLTEGVFTQIRQTAGQAYQAVADAIPTVKPDADFASAVSNLGGKGGSAAKAFPGIIGNPEIASVIQELKGIGEHPTSDWMEAVKELRFNANGNLKNSIDPSKHALGLAQRDAANAIDDLIEREVTAAGKPEVIGAYKSARQLIAKSYDVEGATSVTGDVQARGLARLQAKGRPLNGELKTIADAAEAFPKSMQSVAGFGDNEMYSGHDFFGAGAAALTGHPAGVLGVLGRGPVRSALLSDRVQNTMARGPASLPPPLQIFPTSMYPTGLPEMPQDQKK